jgi:serine/threonine protein kinase/tetratricopeptide (TPR) repeat protein
MIGKTVSHYTILEELGRGGMGVVYKAEDTRLKRTVALKFLPPEFTRDAQARERFIHEAQAAAALNHTNICTIHEIDEADGRYFIVMELIEGESLKERIASGPLPLDTAVDICRQIAAGLEKAHSQGIVHRDIKSANIMITGDGQVKIMDFGLAKSRGTTQLTKEGTTLGTIQYMSPEQARSGEIDHRTDIWSLGIVLFEMVTGQCPFKGDYDQAVVYSILNEEPAAVTGLRTGVPIELERIVAKCLEKDPVERYQHADEFLADIRRFGRQAEPGVRVPVSKDLKTTKKGLWIAIASIAVIAIAIILAWSRLFREKVDVIDSIAVLPLDNLSGDPGQEYFADGMTEALITELSRIKALKVISRTSVIRYKKTDKTIREIARELDVAAVVEGSTMLVEGKVRITAQLIEAATDHHLWADDFERDLEDVFALQKEVAMTIARRIHVAVTPEEHARLTESRPVDPEVQDLYLKGIYMIDQLTIEAQSKGMEYMKQAITLDPDFAPAYAAMAEAYNNLVVFGSMDRQEGLLKSKEWAERALAIDETLGEAYAMLADIRYLVEWDWEGAEEYFKRAIELNPGFKTAHTWYSVYLTAMGRYAEAVSAIRRARELDPMDMNVRTMASWIFAMAGKNEQAVAVAEETLDMGFDHPFLHNILARVYIVSGKIEAGLEEAHKGAELSSDSLARYQLSWMYALAGKTDEAVTRLEETLKLPKKNDLIVANIILTYIFLGNRDAAFEWLDVAYENRNYIIVDLKGDWRFDPIRDDPRFDDLLKRMKLVQ